MSGNRVGLRDSSVVYAIDDPEVRRVCADNVLELNRFTKATEFWYSDAMVSSENNPYEVGDLVDDSGKPIPPRLIARFPTMFWIGTLAFSGFTLMLLRDPNGPAVGLRFMGTAAILWGGGAAIFLSNFRTSYVLSVAMVSQIGIWLWLVNEGLSEVMVVHRILGSICFLMFVLSLFYWWKESALEDRQAEHFSNRN